MERLPTGIHELDLIIGGGLPAGSLVVIAGGPGAGKTILAQQICFANATSERKAVYYTTLSEPHFKLIRHLEPFDFFDASALEERVEFVHLEGLLEESEKGLQPVIDEVVRRCFEAQPAVVVIDSAKAFRDYVDQRPLRNAIYDLAGRVAHSDAVLLFVGEYTLDEMAGAAEFSLADGIVYMAYQPLEPIDRRWLRVLKMRGAAHLSGKHTFVIDHRGVEVFPRLETIAPADAEPPGDERVSTGVQGLDEMMSGGLPGADATAILGPSGSGKTVLGLRFVAKGLEEGERCLYVSFQEAGNQLVHKAASFGWDLAPAQESGQLRIHHVPQGDLNLDAIGAVVRAELAKGGVRRVVLDSLAELVFAAREAERFPAYSRTLVGFIRAAGAAVMITSETTTLGPVTEPLGGLSFLFHNVVLLRYIELESEIRRALSVVKMRDSAHAKDLRQFEVDERGFTVLGRLEGLTGILGWSALRGTEHSSTQGRLS